MYIEKIEAKEKASIVLGLDNKCCIKFKERQRWYLIGVPDKENKFYTIERENVAVQLTEEDYNRLFKVSLRQPRFK